MWISVGTGRSQLPPQQTLNRGATAVCLPQGPMKAFKSIIRPLKEDLEVEKKSGI